MTKAVAQRQRIGPQIRHLRQLRDLTLDDLAGAAGLSASHLSRLERSQTLPSFTVLANIAQVLGVSIDEFVQLEQDLQELDEQLAWQADLLALDESAYKEILGLSIDTRRQLNWAVEVLSEGRLTEITTQENVSSLFAEAVLASDVWPRLARLIDEQGLNPVGLSRAMIQVHEIPGPRVAVLTQSGILGVTPNLDHTAIYRALFPGLPLDPSVARRVRQWRQVAGDAFPYDWPMRLIVHRDFLKNMSKRLDNINELRGAEIASSIASYWRQMLDDGSQLELAVTAADVGEGNTFVCGKSAALIERHQAWDKGAKQAAGVWVSSHDLVTPILETFSSTWETLETRDKDPNVVRDWLATHIAR